MQFSPPPDDDEDTDYSVEERARAAARSTWVSVVVNLLLTTLQIAAGILSRSQGLIADGIHSLSDLVADFVVLLANRHSSKDADADHPYGHQRFENAASLVLGGLLLAVGIGMVWSAFVKLQAPEDATPLAYWTRPTQLLPTDGIVRKTALEAIKGARTDVEKARKLYEWIVANTFREPKVQGCGEGDIKTMLETGNLGGKCADLNALFVGMARSVGLPARDVYGLRLAPSAFGYKELGGNSASLKGAQHCRAEVYLKGHGWVAMDPADVAKVMRQETPNWIRTPQHAVVAPVNKGLFGGWEGNWMAYNMAHDVKLPRSKGPALGFFMYPVGEDSTGRFNSYAPDDFKYQISAREITG